VFWRLMTLQCGAVRCQGTTPVGECIGVSDGAGKLPSLADTIAAVRRELSLAQAAGVGQPVQFRTGPVELEFEVAVTRTGGGQAGVQLWVLTVGAKGELGHASTQRIKVTLQPVDPETGQDARVSDARRGPAPAGPPP
jgi:Trypsin-co-occurring domain 2